MAGVPRTASPSSNYDSRLIARHRRTRGRQFLPVLLLWAVGCWSPPQLMNTEPQTFDGADELAVYDQASMQIETPPEDLSRSGDLLTTAPPVDITQASPEDFREMKLSEAVQLALSHARILRDLGGLVLRSPSSTTTVLDPAIQDSDPRFGVEAALSAFDASFAASTFAEKNDRQLNNTFFGGGTRNLKQDAGVYQTQLSKTGATGTQYILRNNVDYDANNAPGNLFPSIWNVNVEAEFRHPLLQGGGLEFNRIAGPGSSEGLANGVLIARINSDVSLADFEIGVTQFVSDVENAYWDLYYAYRDLDAKIKARDSSLQAWRRIQTKLETGRRGGEKDKEAQAREQYFRLEEEVQNALSGRLIEGTRSNNGSSGGTFRGTGGVYVAERRLRLMMGLEINDGQIIRPITEPGLANVEFDWESTLAETLTRRPELRRQKWLVKRRELELQASKNFLKPQLDAVGRWRWRGLGRDLIRQNTEKPDPTASPTLPRNVLKGDSNNAFESLFDGEFQEWQVGVELTIPLGFRRAHANVRNAELRLARERTVLRAQEREIVHNLSNAIAEKRRAYKSMQISFNRRLAAKTQFEALDAQFKDDRLENQELLMSAQRRLAEAEAAYFKALVEFSLSVKNVHYEKGSLLDFNEVYLAEGESPLAAYNQAEGRRQLRSDIGWLKSLFSNAPVVTEGMYPQLIQASPLESSEQLPAVPEPSEDAGKTTLQFEDMQTTPAPGADFEPPVGSVILPAASRLPSRDQDVLPAVIGREVNFENASSIQRTAIDRAADEPEELNLDGLDLEIRE